MLTTIFVAATRPSSLGGRAGGRPAALRLLSGKQGRKVQQRQEMAFRAGNLSVGSSPQIPELLQTSPRAASLVSQELAR